MGKRWVGAVPFHIHREAARFFRTRRRAYGVCSCRLLRHAGVFMPAASPPKAAPATRSRWPWLRRGLAAFGMLLGYIILTSASYYAILFTPLLIGGLFLLFCKRRLSPVPFVFAQAICTAIVLFLSAPTFHTMPARAEMNALSPYNFSGTLLIDGFFGHDWQYESNLPVRRFSQELSAEAESKSSVFVCTKPAGCEEDINDELWTRLPNTPLPTWMRKASDSGVTP